MSDKPSSHSRSRSYSSSHSHSSDKDSIGSSSRRHSHSRSDRSYSSSKSSHSYSRYSRSRSRDRSRGSSHGVGLPKIFITKLQPFVRQKDIEAEFGKYGRIRKTNLKRGFAFVEFYEKDDAREAIRKLNNKRLFGQQERIVVEEAIGNKRDRDRNRRRYSRSRDRFRDRPRYRDSRDRYYDDRDRYRYRKSDDYSRRRNRKTGPKSTDECYNCGGMGHWANECHMPRNSKKPYKSGHGDRSQYSSNSLDNKAKKQDYSDKKEKVINPAPNLEIKNSKSEPVKEQAEKAKDVEPPKPEEGNQ